jgi:O-antigen/teichoic acid export membrane protein
VATDARDRAPNARRVARNTAFFSIATGLSRLLGLIREVVAAKYFGVTGAMSAFTIAFQVPNLVRALFADSALQGAFVPVFSELLEKGERKEAFRVASSLFFLILLILAAVTALFVLLAEPLMSIFAPGFDDDPVLADLTVNLARLMFPIVVLLALSGLVVGMLNSFEHFAVPALAPVAWNLVIIAALVGLVPVLPDDDEIYAYAIGILAGTIVQFLLPLPWLRGRGGRLTVRLDWRDERVLRVLKLMLPVTIALGLINLSLLINSIFGTLVSPEAPAAIDKAFRIYQLPQGLFSIAVATILFPTMSRFAARGARDDLRRTMGAGVRQICLLLIPSAVLMAVLAEPITRLVYERGGHRPHLDRDGVVVDLAAVPGREPAVLAHLLQPPASLGHHGARRREPRRERGYRRSALRAVRHRGDRARDRGRHGRDVRGAGVDPAPPAGRHRGRAPALERDPDARGGRAAGGALLPHLGRARRAARPLVRRPGGVGAERDRRGLGRVRRRRLGARRAGGAADPAPPDEPRPLATAARVGRSRAWPMSAWTSRSRSSA